MAICLSTLNDEEYPTNFYRFGKCYEKGYGVPINLKNSFIIYSKALSEFDRKTNNLEEVLHMSFVNFYSVERVRERLVKLKQKEEVAVFIKKVHEEYKALHLCEICLEYHSDLLFYPC